MQYGSQVVWYGCIVSRAFCEKERILTHSSSHFCWVVPCSVELDFAVKGICQTNLWGQWLLVESQSGIYFSENSTLLKRTSIEIHVCKVVPSVKEQLPKRTMTPIDSVEENMNFNNKRVSAAEPIWQDYFKAAIGLVFLCHLATAGIFWLATFF